MPHLMHLVAETPFGLLHLEDLFLREKLRELLVVFLLYLGARVRSNNFPFSSDI